MSQEHPPSFSNSFLGLRMTSHRKSVFAKWPKPLLENNSSQNSSIVHKEPDHNFTEIEIDNNFKEDTVKDSQISALTEEVRTLRNELALKNSQIERLKLELAFNLKYSSELNKNVRRLMKINSDINSALRVKIGE